MVPSNAALHVRDAGADDSAAGRSDAANYSDDDDDDTGAGRGRLRLDGVRLAGADRSGAHVLADEQLVGLDRANERPTEQSDPVGSVQ